MNATRVLTGGIDSLRAELADLLPTSDACVGSDEGTHSQPGTFRIYETIRGDRYAVYRHGGSNGSRCTEAEAVAETSGRLLVFPKASKKIRVLAAEVRTVEEEIRKIEARIERPRA